MGYAAMLHPLMLMHAMVGMAPRLFSVLRDSGSTDALRHEIADLGEMNNLTGAHAMIEEAERYA